MVSVGAYPLAFSYVGRSLTSPTVLGFPIPARRTLAGGFTASGSPTRFPVDIPYRAFPFVAACIFAPVAKGNLSIEGSDEFVPSSAASMATGQATLPRRDFHPLKCTRIHGARTFWLFTKSRMSPFLIWSNKTDALAYLAV